MKATARAFGISRSNLMEPRSPRRPRQPDLAEDQDTVDALKAIASRRSTYGYRRAASILNCVRRRLPSLRRADPDVRYGPSIIAHRSTYVPAPSSPAARREQSQEPKCLLPA